MLIRKRRPVIDDRPISRLIQQELIPHTQREFPDYEYDPTLFKLRLQRGITYVAANGKRTRPFGFITAIVKVNCLFIDMLTVHRSYQRKGLGSKLMDRAELYAKVTGCTPCVRLVVVPLVRKYSG
jgi:GNAT superfamily N-acetyltransferase